MQEKCFWDTSEYVAGGSLSENQSTEFLIVGAGVAGLFTAYFLLQHGVNAKDIVLVERNTIGSGSTGHSAGMLVSDIETAPWSVVCADIGKEKASLYYAAQARALDTFEALVHEADIACEFARRDYVIVTGDTEGTKKVLLEHRIHTTLGGTHSILLEGSAFREELQSSLYSVGERLEKGISVNPLACIRGVGAYLRARGVRIFEHTTCAHVSGKIARMPHGDISFSHIIYAQGTAATGDILQNYATTIVVTDPLDDRALDRLHLLDKDMFSDTTTPSFHYMKVTEDNRLLFGCGDEKVTGNSAVVSLDTPMVSHLHTFAERFVGASVSLAYGWTGVFSLSKNTLPYVALTEVDVVMAGMGTQIACVAIADYVASMLTQRAHPLTPLFVK